MDGASPSRHRRGNWPIRFQLWCDHNVVYLHYYCPTPPPRARPSSGPPGRLPSPSHASCLSVFLCLFFFLLRRSGVLCPPPPAPPALSPSDSSRSALQFHRLSPGRQKKPGRATNATGGMTKVVTNVVNWHRWCVYHNSNAVT